MSTRIPLFLIHHFICLFCELGNKARYLAGEARPKVDKVASVAANDCQIVEEAAIKQG